MAKAAYQHHTFTIGAPRKTKLRLVKKVPKPLTARLIKLEPTVERVRKPTLTLVL